MEQSVGRHEESCAVFKQLPVLEIAQKHPDRICILADMQHFDGDPPCHLFELHQKQGAQKAGADGYVFAAFYFGRGHSRYDEPDL